jgi:hypothetical protein
MEPAIIFKAPPKIKGGPEQTAPPPVPPTVSFRVLISTDTGTTVEQLRIAIALQKPPSFLFGGPLLGVAMAADVIVATQGGPCGASERKEPGASSTMQFFDWTPRPSTTAPTSSSSSKAGSDGTLRPLGSQLSTPTLVAWDALSCARVALCAPTRVDVYGVTVASSADGGGGKLTLVHMCCVPCTRTSSALWHRRTLFLVTSSDVLAVFPVMPSGRVSNDRAAAMGLDGTVSFPLVSSAPASPQLDIVPFVANVSSCVLLGVRHGHLLLAVTGSRCVFRPKRSAGLRVFAISLDRDLVKMCMAAVCGHAAVAGHWASRLNDEMRGTAAVLLSVRGRVRVC